MQVSIAPAPESGAHFKCYSCETHITTSHVLCQTDRKARRFCTAKHYGDWRKDKARKEAA